MHIFVLMAYIARLSTQGAGHKRRRQSGGGMGPNCIEICQRIELKSANMREGGDKTFGKKCRRLL